jgi:hypothetical protein
MSGIYPIYEDTDLGELAFEMFADTYPHEAAELDWVRFFDLCKKRNPAITEEVARKLLAETQ